jgi:2-C-methyl-D-erythritol 2,4-cyclodiphosphate synthase
VGNGFDIHRFAGESPSDGDGRVLVLGGVRFDGERPLVGHSDADVIAHACAEALLGAAGLGDIGQLYPDTDARWSGADSIGLLADVALRLRAAGWQAVNVDCSVVAEAPKLAPARAQMEERLSGAAGAPVTVKGRRAESLGALGRGEGIAVWATALIESIDGGEL